MNIYKPIRKLTKRVKIGNKYIGANYPILIQSMTNTKTTNIQETLNQILNLSKADCKMIRISIPDEDSIAALKIIKKNTDIPIIADIHYNPLLAIESIKAGVDKIRINPGNINSEKSVLEIISVLKEYGTALRIGINSGSLEKNLFNLYKTDPSLALFKSAEHWTIFFAEKDIKNIVVSIKSSSVPITIKANKLFSDKFDFPIHLGITEAGTYLSGSIYSSVGLGILLNNGIGDTIRVSLSTDPIEEIKIAKMILKSLNIITSFPRVIACPTCSRCEYAVSNLAKKVEDFLIKKNINIVVAVMGCIVNGPGESKEADIGIAGGKNSFVLFKKGKIIGNFPISSVENILFSEIIKFSKND